ncbi:hypothetical protein EJV47_05725 [Hymenobacter gummosus]|uniref:Uncharacterized protein n=1 Tax=Hymenobacter gummosus TaxID=1776032 RepID=A0A431U7X9_9BACT|nr:hypothetical protein [Hymenobacter gummosus]RTQ52510.1 hypothetical protein EJV47_05725 [Hymenobacter gummosus]
MSPNPTPETAVAVVYPRQGPALRLPLRAAAPPERQLMQWLRQRAATEAGFAGRIRSLLLLTPAPLSPAGHAALRQFLRPAGLDARLRVQTLGRAAPPAAEAAAPNLLDELLGETALAGEGMFSRAADWVKKKLAEKALRDALNQPVSGGVDPYNASPPGWPPVVRPARPSTGEPRRTGPYR